MNQVLTAPCARQKGATMLEMMVSILVLSFGLLGLLGLLTHGLKMTSSSHVRTIAAQQVADMAEKISANPYFAYEYAPPSDSLTTDCLTTTKCSNDPTLIPDLIANTEYALWRDNVEALLPGGEGTVCLHTPSAQDIADRLSSNFTCSAAGRITIKVCWNERSRVGISGNSGTDPLSCLTTQI